MNFSMLKTAFIINSPTNFMDNQINYSVDKIVESSTENSTESSVENCVNGVDSVKETLGEPGVYIPITMESNDSGAGIETRIPQSKVTEVKVLESNSESEVKCNCSNKFKLMGFTLNELLNLILIFILLWIVIFKPGN